ncbi:MULTISPECIES: YciI family protein [unclassified Streptomyces]|uniref:YciI family protein n=1 Tax=unclassified Streptomyces TaxID=2593676 RepID=UPI00382D87F7
MILHVTATMDESADPAPFREEEHRVLEELRAEGTVLAAFRRHDRRGAFLVAEAADPADARARLGRLPFVAHGILTLEYAEVSPL